MFTLLIILKTKRWTSLALIRKRKIPTQKSKVRIYKNGGNDFIRKEFLNTDVKKTCKCFKLLLDLQTFKNVLRPI